MSSKRVSEKEEITMTDYEKILSEEEGMWIKRLVALKGICEENGLDLKEYLLSEIAEELQMMRMLKENED